MGRRKRGAAAAAGLTLAELRRLIDEREGKLAELAARRDALAAELQELDAEIGDGGAPAPRRRRRGRKPGPKP
ncbi:MAG TPA: hypothetical protein VFG37_02365, partial [Planctomycetota bacterium]|nr:hypothetical protein [Planctomycetota bacterium]